MAGLIFIYNKDFFTIKMKIYYYTIGVIIKYKLYYTVLQKLL